MRQLTHNAFPVLLAIAVHFPSLSYSDVLRAPQGEARIIITSQGHFKSIQGVLIAKIDRNGSVRDSHGRLLGKVTTNGHIFDANGRQLGYVENQGKVRTKDGKLLGQIHDNGRVEDSHGRLLFSLQNIKKEWIAVYIFFDLINSTEKN